MGAKRQRISSVEAIRGIDNDGELIETHVAINVLARENKSLYARINTLEKQLKEKSIVLALANQRLESIDCEHPPLYMI